MKILLSTSGSLGDILVLFPILSGIRKQYPDARITLLNKHDSYAATRPLELARQAGYVDDICIVSNFKLKLLKFLSFFPYSGKKYDEIFFLQRNGKTLPKKLRQEIPFLQRISKNPVRGACILTSFDDPHRTYPQTMELMLARINHDNPHPIRIGSSLFPITKEERAAAQKILQSLPIPKNAIPFVVCIGGKKAVSHWPLACYAKLLKKVIETTSAIPIFIGGRGDQKEIRSLLAELPENKAFYLPQFAEDLHQSIVLMSCCKFYLGNDTGSIHMAAAAGLRCVGIFSGHSPAGLWSPLGAGHKVLRADPVPDCVGCRKSDCQYGFPARCMTAITPERVYSAVLEILK